MKDAFKVVLIFGAIYFVWNLFWRTAFFLSDLVGPAVAFVLIGTGLYWLFGRSNEDKPNVP